MNELLTDFIANEPDGWTDNRLVGLIFEVFFTIFLQLQAQTRNDAETYRHVDTTCVCLKKSQIKILGQLNCNIHRKIFLFVKILNFSQHLHRIKEINISYNLNLMTV